MNELRDQYQPIGRAEELEVERIAICWWKLKRAWRYENATNRVALRNFGRKELAEQEDYCKTHDQEEKAVILLLQSAMSEIGVTGEISQELKQKMFATMPGLEAMWPGVEAAAQEVLNSPAFSDILRKSSAQDRASAIAGGAAAIGVSLIEQLGQSRQTSVLEIAIAQQVIPNSESLDRLLRYETTIDRDLTRAVDRLECLQRRRRE